MSGVSFCTTPLHLLLFQSAGRVSSALPQLNGLPLLRQI